MIRLPFAKPAVWYPALGLLALEEIVELPIVTAVVVGRLIVERRARHPETGVVGTSSGTERAPQANHGNPTGRPRIFSTFRD